MDGYLLHERVGNGAQAEVWRGEAVGRPGRLVAVKRFTTGATVDSIVQVRREAEALERLSHPSIVRLLDVPTDGDSAALVTPFLSGGTLSDRIARSTLPVAAVADLGARLGDALAAAHSAGVVHADVKPANILFDAEDQPLLTDFGTAVLRGHDLDDVHGTATYLAPEVADGTTAPTAASDQYALGVVLYEALAGVPPYAAPTVAATLRAAARGVHLPLAQLVDDVPEEVVTAIERAMARDPAARWPNARDLASRLEEVRTTLGSWSMPPPSGPPAGASAVGLPPPLDRSKGSRPPPPPRSDRTPLPTPPSPPPGGRAPDSAPAATSGGDPSLTRRFGPAPPPAAEPAAPSRRRVPLLLAAGAAVLVPVAIVLALVLGGRGGDGPLVLPTETATPIEDPTPVPLPPCEDAPPTPTGVAETVPADTEGRGCTVDLGWDPDTRVLTVPRDDGDPLRFELGQEGDQLLVGDWNCDDRQTPGLYRPSTGEVFAFDGFAGEGGSLESRPAEATGIRDGEPFVATGDDGCDRIEVRGDA